MQDALFQVIRVQEQLDFIHCKRMNLVNTIFMK